MEKSQVELPEDLIARILQRLPLISNLRFRCVCKAWHSLLSDPVFIYKALTCIDRDDGQVLIKDYNPYPRRSGFSHISLDCRTQLAIQDWPGCLTIVGSYNGLICLTDHWRVILVWNPLTRETKELPKSPNYTDSEDFDERFESVTFEVGFCFDAKTNDYTVIKIFHLFYDGLQFRGAANAVFLYSFSSGHWKKLDVSLLVGTIPDVFGVPPMIRTPTNCGEKFYHWVAVPCTTFRQYEESFSYVDMSFSYVVLSFDMELQRIETTELPYTMNYDEQLVKRGLEIGFFMLKKYVAISASPSGVEDPIFEISVLVKVGVKESWMKLIRIGPIIYGQSILNPWREGKLFVETSKGEVKLWDPFEGEVAIVSSNERPPRYYIELITYKATQQRIVLGLDC